MNPFAKYAGIGALILGLAPFAQAQTTLTFGGSDAVGSLPAVVQ